MDVFLYFEHLPGELDREDIVVAFEDREDAGIEVTGMGLGQEGGNVDLEIDDSVLSHDEALRLVARALTDLNIAHLIEVHLPDTGERMLASDIQV